MIVEPDEVREGAIIRRHGHAAPSTWRIAQCARLGEVGMVNAGEAATIDSRGSAPAVPVG